MSDTRFAAGTTKRFHLRRLFKIAFFLLGLCAPLSAALALDPSVSNVTFQPPKLEIPIPDVSFSQGLSGDSVITLPWVAQYVSGVYTFLLSIVGLVAATMMIVGGFQYLTSGGDQSKISAGKKRIIDALIGMTLAFGSYLLLYTINPNLVSFASLQLVNIQTVAFGGAVDAKMDTAGVSEPATTAFKLGSCSDPGFAISDPLAFDKSINAQAITALTSSLVTQHPGMVAIYKQAQDVTNVPWEMIAAVHYGEGGNSPNQSILNGGPLCNAGDDRIVLQICSECMQAKTTLNDIICGARVIQHNVQAKGFGALTTDNSAENLQRVKIGFCMMNGCWPSQFACPEKSSYVAASFDANHKSYPPKSAHDCVSPVCNPALPLKDDTVQQANRGTGGCTIKVWPQGEETRGAGCTFNQPAACCVSGGDGSRTCTYTPTLYSKTNPCGAGILKQDIPSRPGALVDYGIIKYLEQNGTIH